MLAAWSSEAPGPTDSTSAILQDPTALTVVVGHLLGPAPARWARHVADQAGLRSPRALQDDLRGIYAAAHLDRTGQGWAVADPLGLRCTYWAEDDEVLVLASRAALVSRAITRSDREPARNVAAGAWLAFTTYRVGDETGYHGVRVVPPGSILHFEDDGARWAPHRLIAEAEDRRGTRHLEDLASTVIDDVGASLRAVLETDAAGHVIALTGGKDSRLLLAVAVQQGIADEFTYETAGFRGMADVDIAAELSGELGLRHQLAAKSPASTEPYAARVTRFVGATGCMVNAWDLDAPRGDDAIRVSGIGGEPLRNFVRLRGRRTPELEVEKAFRRQRYGKAELLLPRVAEHLYATLLEELAKEPDPDCDPRIRLYAHFAQNRMRFSRVGPREELPGDRRVQPLYSPVTVRAALTLPIEDLQSELLFAAIMRRASPVLVRHRFAAAGWDDRALAYLADGTVPPPPAAPRRRTPEERAARRAAAAAAPPAPPEPPVAASPRRPTPDTLMARLYENAGQDRLDLFRDLVADDANPTWEFVDQARTRAALGRYEELTNNERREVFGVVTMLTWGSHSVLPGG